MLKVNKFQKILIASFLLIAFSVILYTIYVKFVSPNQDPRSGYVIGKVQSYVVREE